MKGLSILGSTGSIGTNVLRVVDAFPGRFEVVGLAAGGNVEVLAEQSRPPPAEGRLGGGRGARSRSSPASWTSPASAP